MCVRETDRGRNRERERKPVCGVGLPKYPWPGLTLEEAGG